MGQHISASFTVIILSLESGRLSAGSSFGHAPLCFHALIGCFRKEGCISLALPASCCVQQQSPTSPPPPRLRNREVSFHRTLLFCRGILLLNTSVASHPGPFAVTVTHMFEIHKLLHLCEREVRLKLKRQRVCSAERPPVGWCALECMLIIETARSVRPSSPQT